MKYAVEELYTSWPFSVKSRVFEVNDSQVSVDSQSENTSYYIDVFDTLEEAVDYAEPDAIVVVANKRAN